MPVITIVAAISAISWGFVIYVAFHTGFGGSFGFKPMIEAFTAPLIGIVYYIGVRLYPAQPGHAAQPDVRGDPAGMTDDGRAAPGCPAAESRAPRMRSLPWWRQGRAIVAAAAARSIPVRLVGGVAIWLRGSAAARAALGRSYPDIDLVAHKKQSRALRAVLEEEGFEPERVFNATHGARRLLYHGPGGWQVDVFLDTFEMSHTLDLGTRLRGRARDARRGRAAAHQAADRRGQRQGPVGHGDAAVGSRAGRRRRSRPAQPHPGGRAVRAPTGGCTPP